MTKRTAGVGFVLALTLGLLAVWVPSAHSQAPVEVKLTMEKDRSCRPSSA